MISVTLGSVGARLNHFGEGERLMAESLPGLNNIHSYILGRQSSLSFINPDSGVVNVMDHFNNYMEIPQVRHLADQVKTIQENLGQQILSDFKVCHVVHCKLIH